MKYIIYNQIQDPLSTKSKGFSYLYAKNKTDKDPMKSYMNTKKKKAND